MSSKSYLDKKESSQEVAIFSLVDLKGSEIHYIYSSLWQQYQVRRIRTALGELSPMDPITRELDDLLKVFAPLKTSFIPIDNKIHFHTPDVNYPSSYPIMFDTLVIYANGGNMGFLLSCTTLSFFGFRTFTIDGIDYTFSIPPRR